LTQLKGLFADSSAGAGHVVLVDGGPGVGKTRLIQAFCDYVVESGALLLTATGSRAERTLRMGVVDQLFQGAALAPEFSERVSRLVTVDCQPEIDPDPVTISQADVGSVHALCAVLLELSRQRPVVVAIDDLHFVDGVTLQVLLYLRRRLRSARILLVLGEWAQPRLTRPLFRAELARQPHHRITLGPLSRDGVAELLAQHLDASTATRLAPAVYLLSGGNPLLVHALVDDYRSERRTQTGTDARQPVAGAAFGEAVLTCLLRWGSELLTVARGLATLGRSATPALVGRLVGVTPDVAAEVFDVLSAAGLLESECFEQPEAVAAVLNGLSADDRSRLHARAAKLLLAQGAAASAVARQIIAAGGVAEQWAVGLLRKTADQALANDEVETALTSLELAMGAGAGEQELVEIRAVLARAEWRVNPSAAARHVYPLHRAIGDGLLAGPDGAVVVRHLLWQGDGEGAAKALHLLIGEAGPAGDQTAAELRLAYHWMYGRLPRPATRENGARARVASRLTATSASPWARAADGLSSMFTSAAGNEVASSAEYILQRRLSDTTLEAVAVALFALCYADKPSQAAFWCDALLGEAARRRATTWQAVLRSVRADIAFRQGDLAAAEAQASTALGLLHADSWGVVIGYPLSTLLLTNVAMGRREPADELAKRVVPDAMLHTLFGLRYLHACGHHHLASGRLLAAFSDFERCGTMMRQSDLDVPALVPWRSDLALTQLRLGRPKAPRDLVCEQLGRPGGATGGRVRGISLRVLAATSELRQRPALLREAIDLLQVAGDRLELARALADLSQAHDELGEYGRARAIAGRAAHEAKACQAEALSARLSRHRLAETLSKTSDEQADDLPALSDAERRVATLAAFGHTNREIGRKLYITVSTVEQHLTRVYRKLKVNGRSGLPACLSQYRAPPMPAESATRPPAPNNGQVLSRV
jgi:DNA-binding CsgD family transcriptional regulator